MFNLGTEFKSRGLTRQMPKQSVAQMQRKRSPDDYEKAARIRRANRPFAEKALSGVYHRRIAAAIAFAPQEIG